jgi:hypothetical protein
MSVDQTVRLQFSPSRLPKLIFQHSLSLHLWPYITEIREPAGLRRNQVYTSEIAAVAVLVSVVKQVIKTNSVA